MLYPARWKKITVDQSKVPKNWLFRFFLPPGINFPTWWTEQDVRCGSPFSFQDPHDGSSLPRVQFIVEEFRLLLIWCSLRLFHHHGNTVRESIRHDKLGLIRFTLVGGLFWRWRGFLRISGRGVTGRGCPLEGLGNWKHHNILGIRLASSWVFHRTLDRGKDDLHLWFFGLELGREQNWNNKFQCTL